MDLVADLGAGTGTTAVIGAGGKKSAIYTLAGRIDRAVVTATVRIPPFDEHVAAVVRTADPAAALDSVTDWPVGLVPDYEDSRYLGYDPTVVDTIDQRGVADAVLVKADGARNREFKAPGDDEPRIPPGADRVLLMVSTHVVGKPLEAPHVHRPERVAALTGRSIGEPITVEDVATVATDPAGGRKNVPPGAELFLVLNKVDDDADEATAREIAAAVMELSGGSTHDGPPSIDRVALTKLIDENQPLVDVID